MNFITWFLEYPHWVPAAIGIPSIILYAIAQWYIQVKPIRDLRKYLRKVRRND